MSKLLRYKRWLTIEEASKNLSILLGEPVQQHDIYRLAIDGTLRLSVVFLSHFNCREAHKKTGEIKFENVPSLDAGYFVKIPIGGPIYESIDGEDYQMSQMVGHLSMDTPYWLPMIGGEVQSVEQRYWETQGIERSSTIDLDGTFVALENHIYRVEEQIDSSDISRGFFPVGSLPKEAEFVVTPADLMAFQNTLLVDSSPAAEKPITTREKTTLLNIIGALLEINGTKGLAIIDAILEKYPNAQGLKKRTLEEKFAEAKRSLLSSQ